MVNILAVGDVSGPVGLDMLSRHLRSIKKMRDIAFTVVNGENADVIGITPRQADGIFESGADVITLGNHTWARRELIPYLEDNDNILRPLNFASVCPGRGMGIYHTDFGDVRVISLIGRYTMDSNTDNPFVAVNNALVSGTSDITLVEMHAEVTSERLAMGYYLDGRVSAVWGTHTHVQTSDAGVFPRGTGYISDLGMTGPIHSVLGIKPEQSISRFLGGPPRRYEAVNGPGKIECAIFSIDELSGSCISVEALRIT